MNINVCFSPLLYSSYIGENENNTIVIVADVFRATTSMCAALKNGAKSIIPVRTVEEAFDYKQQGYLVGGERNMEVLKFGDFGNSPSDYSEKLVKGHEVVISTTNGTRAIDEASNCYCLIIGSFSNLSAIAEYCISQQKDVLVLCAGWKDTFNMEDTLFGGAMVEKLAEAGFNASFDASQIALSMWKEAKPDVMKYLERSEHIKRLAKYNLLEVARFCVTPDTANVLPVYDKGTKRITNKLV